MNSKEYKEYDSSVFYTDGIKHIDNILSDSNSLLDCIRYIPSKDYLELKDLIHHCEYLIGNMGQEELSLMGNIYIAIIRRIELELNRRGIKTEYTSFS
jgi:hypothetical protein